MNLFVIYNQLFVFFKKCIRYIANKIVCLLITPIKNLKKKLFFFIETKRLHNSFEKNKFKILETINKKRLYKILKIAKKHSPYYKKFITKKHFHNCFETIQTIPLLTRQILIEKGEEIKVDNINKLQHFEMSTSGTTGIPLKFTRGLDYEWSHQMFLYEFMTGLKIIDLNKIISFGGKYLDDESLSKNIFWTLREPGNIYGYCLFSTFYLNKNNIPYYIQQLELIKPYIIRSYPSALLLFCDLCNELNVKPDIEIKGIYVTSENITKEQMEKISKFFNCGVYGQYGHSEACVFAFTNKNDTKYYCSPLYGYVEIVDESGKHVKEGEIGNVCVTSFTNYAQPFIRYLTGDLAEYGGKEKGFTVLNQLIGRSQDYILNSKHEKVFIIVGEFSECFLPAINNVKYWQAIQDEIGKMKLKIVPKDNYSKNDEEEIIQVMKNSNVEITSFEYVNDIPLTKSGKRKYIINLLI